MMSFASPQPISLAITKVPLILMYQCLWYDQENSPLEQTEDWFMKSLDKNLEIIMLNQFYFINIQISHWLWKK